MVMSWLKDGGVAKFATELTYAVRPRVVLKYVGQLSLVLAVLTLVPCLVALMGGESVMALRFALLILGLLLLGVAGWRLPAPSAVQINEGMVVVALMYLLAPLIMTYPLMSGGLPFVDAMFEAISGITTTGLSTLPGLNGMPDSLLFLRAWLQWVGGLGIVVLSLAHLVSPGVVAKGLAVTEAESDDLVGGLRAHARRMLRVYLLLTGLGVLGAWLAGVDAFQSVLYVLSSVSTGGFAPQEASLANLGGMAQLWISLCCLAGAVPLTFYQLHPVGRTDANLAQLRSLLLACLLVTLLMLLALRLGSDLPWAQALQHAPLLAISAQSTAGFNSLSLSLLDGGGKMVLIVAMFMGGGLGSTAGGIKLWRMLIAVTAVRWLLLRTALSRHAVLEPRLAGRHLEPEEIHGALLLILLFVLGIFLSWVPFVLMGYDPLDALFDVVSAMGTVGLSTGVTGEQLPTILKAVLCMDMLMGRLEIIAWLILIYPGSWWGRRRGEA